MFSTFLLYILPMAFSSPLETFFSPWKMQIIFNTVDTSYYQTSWCTLVFLA